MMYMLKITLRCGTWGFGEERFGDLNDCNPSLRIMDTCWRSLILILLWYFESSMHKRQHVWVVGLVEGAKFSELL